MKNKHKRLNKRLFCHDPEDIGLSSIVVSELCYGVSKSGSSKNQAKLDVFLSSFQLFDFDIMAAKIYGEIRAKLEKKGLIIGPYDLQIAAHAISKEVILVTNNTREFSRVPNLEIEDWV